MNEGRSAVSPQRGADRCPRCGSGFHCGAADAAPCACSTLVLPAALQSTLRARFSGCLCMDCLRDLADGAPVHNAPGGAPG
jgi:hypothetical protein